MVMVRELLSLVLKSSLFTQKDKSQLRGSLMLKSYEECDTGDMSNSWREEFGVY